MRKQIIFLLISSVSTAWAANNFTVCYHNKTKMPVSYNNSGISHKWKSRGELTGNGTVEPDKSECFSRIVDETIFTKDYITFSVNNKWVGIVNSAFAKPYVIAQEAQAKKGGKLLDNTASGKDNYTLNIFVTNEGIRYSNSDDLEAQNELITPRTFN